MQPFKFYLKHEVTYKIIEHKWVMFCGLGAVFYLYHLLWTISGVNMYTDYTRQIGCGSASGGGDASSAIFDMALLLSTVFHMVEWIRWTLFLTSALVSFNLIPLFYLF